MTLNKINSLKIWDYLEYLEGSRITTKLTSQSPGFYIYMMLNNTFVLISTIQCVQDKSEQHGIFVKRKS